VFALQINYRRTIRPDLRKLYQLYVGRPLGDQDKAGYLMICVQHVQMECVMDKQVTAALSFAVLVTWRTPKIHVDDCYF
jgi:hypothetical protein